MPDAGEFAGVSAAEWLAWPRRIGRKLDAFFDELTRFELPAPEAGDIGTRIAALEERVAKIEGKLDIPVTFEPN